MQDMLVDCFGLLKNSSHTEQVTQKCGSTAKGQVDTPIVQEMKCILNHKMAENHVTLIDDARCFTGENDYPTLETLERIIRKVRPSWTFEV